MTSPPARSASMSSDSFRSSSQMAWSRTWNRVRLEIARYRKAAPKLLALDRRDWSDLVRAQRALFHAQREMKSMPTGSMVRDEPEPQGEPTGNRIDDARRIALAVNRAASY